MKAALINPGIGKSIFVLNCRTCDFQ